MSRKVARTTAELCQEMGREVSDVVSALSPKHQRRALKNALNKEARAVRKAAQSSLSSQLGTGLRANRSILDSVTAKTFKSMRGFVVTVNHGGRGSLQGQYMTRAGYKPLALWANYGTVQRKRRGAMPALNFMAPAEAMLPQVETRLAADLDRNIAKAISKYAN